MKFETIEDLVLIFNKYKKNPNLEGVLLPKKEPIFRKLSNDEINKKLACYGLKCIIDNNNCCASTHNRYICRIDTIP